MAEVAYNPTYRNYRLHTLILETKLNLGDFCGFYHSSALRVWS